MTCYYLRPAWFSRDKQGNIIRDENGKTGRPKFTHKGTQLDPDVEIPCGKCIGCRASQARDWGVRIHHESLLHKENSFITLTYDPEHLPDDGKLSVHHAQKFIMRMRKHGYKLRYYLAGEYGDKHGRPHYHAAIFGHDFLDHAYPDDNGYYRNPELTKIWGQGDVLCAPLEPASAMYVAGYINKKVGDEDVFALQSRRPPIAKQWVLENKHRLGNRSTLFVGGKDRPIPKKYKEWVDDFDYVASKHRYQTPDIDTLRNREINFGAKQKLKESKTL